MTEYANNRLNEVFPLLEKAISDAFDDGYRAARMQIQAEQSNVYGKWLFGDKMENYPAIHYKPWCHYCSACGSEANRRTDDIEFLDDFCPHCGAEMR